MPPQTDLQQAAPAQNQVPAAATGSATADVDGGRAAAQAGHLAAPDAPSDALAPPAPGDIGINSSVNQGAGAGAPVSQGQVKNTVRRLYFYIYTPPICMH